MQIKKKDRQKKRTGIYKKRGYGEHTNQNRSVDKQA